MNMELIFLIRKTLFLALFTFIVGGSLYTQSGENTALTGKWSLVEGPTRNNPENMELRADGTGIIDRAEISWRTSDGRFYLTHPLLTASWNYQVSSSTLTFTDNNGTILKYNKVSISSAQEYDAESDFMAEPVSGGKSVRITDYKGGKWAVRIPPSIQKIPVTHIWLNAFRNKKLISVTIPNSVTSILDTAFADNQLTDVTIPGSVTSLGQYAFFNNQLTSVTIPNSVKEIKAGTFARNKLTSITIGTGVQLATDDNPEFSVYPSFGNGFERAYINGGKRAGTYTRPNTNSTAWTRQP